MKIILVGASGTIGRAVSEELSQRHEVIRVGRTRGDYQVDITSQESVEALFAQTGEVDAIVSTTPQRSRCRAPCKAEDSPKYMIPSV